MLTTTNLDQQLEAMKRVAYWQGRLDQLFIDKSLTEKQIESLYDDLFSRLHTFEMIPIPSMLDFAKQIEESK